MFSRKKKKRIDLCSTPVVSGRSIIRLTSYRTSTSQLINHLNLRPMHVADLGPRARCLGSGSLRVIGRRQVAA